MVSVNEKHGSIFFETTYLSENNHIITTLGSDYTLLITDYY